MQQFTFTLLTSQKNECTFYPGVADFYSYF